MYDKQNKDSIKTLFQNISGKYDLINNLMSFGLHGCIKKQAVKNIKKVNAKNIIDLCTGTGDILLFLKELYPQAEIMGVDFSANMLEIARNRTKENKNIYLKQMDITKLEFAPNSFDICFISFGLRNLPNIKQTLNDIKTILKPSGIISILDLGKPNHIIKPLFNIYFNHVIPMIGKFFNKDINPYLYLVNSVKTYPPQKELIQLLQEIGFKDCKNIDYACGVISQQIAIKE